MKFEQLRISDKGTESKRHRDKGIKCQRAGYRQREETNYDYKLRNVKRQRGRGRGSKREAKREAKRASRRNRYSE